MKKFNFEKFGFYRNIFFIGFFALFLCLLLFATTFDVHAASQTDGSLPYIIPNFRFANNFLPDDVIQTAIDKATSDARNTLNYQGDLTYLVYTQDGIINGLFYEVYLIPNPSITNNVLSDYNFLDGTVRVNANGIQIQRVIVRINNGAVGGSFYNLGSYADLLGNSVTSSLNGGNFTPRYPFYYSGFNDIVSLNDVVVFSNSVPSVIPTGHATQPNNDPNNLINGSNGNPISRPTKPTPTPYTPTIWNPPSIVTSTIESLLESIWECLDYGFNYLKDNIGGYFSNLLSNLDGWFEYLVDSVFYAGNKIVKSIQDLATDLYNNFVSLFEPLYDFLSSVSSFFSSLVDLGTDENGDFSLTSFFVKLLIPDTDDLSASLLQGDIFAVVPLSFAIKNFVDTFIYTINNLQVSKVFTIPGFTAFGQTFPSYQMDFSWFDDYKPYSDTIISGFLLIGYMHWFFVQASSMLRGAGVVGHEQSTDASKKVGD